MKAGRTLESAEVFESLLHRTEWIAWARFGLGESYFIEERYREALVQLELAIDANPEVREFYSLKLEVSQYEGDTVAIADARKHLVRSYSEQEPYDRWIQDMWSQCYDSFRLLRLAQAELLVGNRGRAIQVLRRVEQLDPKDERVRELLEGI